ncbi:DegT/DnrJ/EryC1/StrS family aminotransferase [Bacteroides heparinolyticus]
MFGERNVLMTSSGRSALYHILCYLPQNKVVVPAYTCDVVVEAALLAGKTVIYSHIDEETLNAVDYPKLDSDSIVIATHQYGFPCRIKDICEECKRKGSVVIEDCAGAFGTSIEGQPVGTFGDYAIFSFNASKLINSPSTGGFLLVKNENDYNALKDMIQFNPCTYKYKVKNLLKGLGFCLDKNAFMHYWLSKATRRDSSIAHLSAKQYSPKSEKQEEYLYGFYDWQAYIVLKQIRKLQELIKSRDELKQVYQDNLNPVFQSCHFERQGVSIRYPVLLKNRDEIRLKARELGVEVGFGFEHFVCPDDYEKELEIGKQIAYLPFSSHFLKTEISQIVKVLNQVSNEQGINS